MPRFSYLAEIVAGIFGLLFFFAQPAAAAPSAPFRVAAVGSPGAVTISWQGAVGTKSYVIFRSSTAKGGFQELTRGVLGRSYQDTGLETGKIYSYYVIALGAHGRSPRSEIVSASAARAADSAPAGWNIPFPRLAMWWPSVWEKKLYSRVASYDWIAVDWYDLEQVQQHIKPLNPQLKLAASFNYTETAAFTAAGADGPNIDVRDLPAEFFLTQVGSVLSSDVSASQTTLAVAETRLPNGKPRFAAGDYLLLERETLKVTAVNSTAHVLTVKRGVFRPAAAHAAGTRIAAAISFWPGTFVMNIGGGCGKTIADTSAGEEDWVDYVVRKFAQLSLPIDAIQVDRSDGDQSWLVDSGYARSIDIDCTNRFTADYQSFDTAWNAGMRRMLSGMSAAHPAQALFLNNGIAAYDILNGSIMEDVLGWGSNPKAPLSSWEQWVLGRSGHDSYLGWLELSLQPNWTLWEVYEDSRGPSDVDGNLDNYDNPAAKPGFVPDYQRMRFGLGTALLGDGFYSYEVSTFVHGSSYLMWFDEYDNAGAGRGYLGLPLGGLTVAKATSGRGVVYRRDFAKGVVLVNPSGQRQTVELGGRFWKIKGRQDRSVNSGAAVHSVTLAPQDSIVLLRKRGTSSK